MVTMEVTLVQGVARANKGNIVCHVWIIPGSQIRYLCTNYQSFFDTHTLYLYQVTNHFCHTFQLKKGIIAHYIHIFLNMIVTHSIDS